MSIPQINICNSSSETCEQEYDINDLHIAICMSSIMDLLLAHEQDNEVWTTSSLTFAQTCTKGLIFIDHTYHVAM